MKKKEKQNTKCLAMLGAAGREGSMELKDFDEFWRVYTLMQFLEEVEEKLKKAFGRKVDLGCSIDLLRAMANAPEKNRILVATEKEDVIEYRVRCVDTVEFNEEDALKLKEAAEHGCDLFAIAILDDGRVGAQPSNFQYELDIAKPKAEEMWDGMNNIMDNVTTNGTYKDKD